MQIFVDADACPVVGIVEKVAKEHSVPVTLHIIPIKGSGKKSGKNASPSRPSAANISDATMHTRYPI